MPGNEARDRFGINQLYPDAPNGRRWLCTWDNGVARELKRSRERDPEDPTGEFVLRGKDCSVAIDGEGVARLRGASPRMYVYDEGEEKTWGNVEITFYAKRVKEYGYKSSQGFVAGARSEHQNADADRCSGMTYYGRMLYDGRINFQKELVHGLEDNGGYTDPLPPAARAAWDTSDGKMPAGSWVGYKFVVRNSADGSRVRLRLYRDRADGADGGHWEKLLDEEDAGNWHVQDVADCGHRSDQILLDPGTAVFIRNDLIEAAEYKKFSVREIEAES